MDCQHEPIVDITYHHSGSWWGEVECEKCGLKLEVKVYGRWESEARRNAAKKWERRIRRK